MTTSVATSRSTATRRPSAGVGDWVQSALNVAAVVSMAGVMYAALVYALPATNISGAEQLVQRTIYIHIGSAFAALAAFLMSLIGSIVYLTTRNLDWDRVTQASIESGMVFGLGIIITGSIWAKIAWNTWWTWDPRLTSSTITVLIYTAYLLFRNGIDDRVARARFSSIYALLAFLSVPFTYYSARWFRSIHPVVWNGENAEAQGDFGLGASMEQALFVALIGFCVLFSALMIQRWRQLRLADRVEALREDVLYGEVR